MTNKITFTVDTEAPYSAGEKEELLDAFIAFITDVDGDADADSAEIDIVDSANNLANEKKKQEEIREAAAGLIANGALSVRVAITDLDDNMITEHEFSSED